MKAQPMSKHLEQINRRAFLRGLTLTSAGLLVPKAVQVFVPPLPFAEPRYLVSIDPGLTATGLVINRCHAPFMKTLALFKPIETLHIESLFPNLSYFPKPS